MLKLRWMDIEDIGWEGVEQLCSCGSKFVPRVVEMRCVERRKHDTATTFAITLWGLLL